jgi:hypothetical protein
MWPFRKKVHELISREFITSNDVLPEYRDSFNKSRRELKLEIRNLEGLNSKTELALVELKQELEEIYSKPKSDEALVDIDRIHAQIINNERDMDQLLSTMHMLRQIITGVVRTPEELESMQSYSQGYITPDFPEPIPSIKEIDEGIWAGSEEE